MHKHMAADGQVSTSNRMVEYCSLTMSGQIQHTKTKTGQMDIPGVL